MEDLSGGIVQIVLNLNEGKGFEAFKQPIFVTASLNGHKLNSDAINPSSNPYFGTDLVWEAEKKTVKRLRTINTIIKLEFFCGVNGNDQDRIGFILCHLKSAQIISPRNNHKLVESWQKILGLKTRSKISRPEVLLSLRIEELSDAEITGVPTNYNTEPLQQSSSRSEFKNVPKPVYNDIHSPGEKPYVQIGPLHQTPEMFHFTVIIGPAQNLFKSFSEMLISSTSNCIHFAYSIFGEYVTLSPISDDSYLSKSSHFVKSSYSYLNSYLQQNNTLNLALYHGTNKIGSTRISLQPFSTKDVEFRYELESKNFFRIHEKCPIFFERDLGKLDSDFQPSVNVMITVTKIDPKFESCIISKTSSFENSKSVMDKHQGKFDEIKPDSAQITNESESQKHQETEVKMKQLEKTSSLPSMQDKIIPNAVDNYKILEPSLRSGSPSAVVQDRSPIICSLVIKIDSIIFKQLPIEGKFGFKLYHPKAAETISISWSEEVKEINKIFHFTQPLTAKMDFKLPSPNLKKLHEHPLEVFIEHPTGIFAQADFFLPSVNNKEYCCVGIAEANKEMACGCMQPVAFLYATLCLSSEDSLLQTNEKCLNQLANKELIYKVVEELEDWKEKQELMFKYKLKEKEETYLKNLSEEWEKQRKELERKLINELKSCEDLRKKLHSVIDGFHERFHHLTRREAEVSERAAEEERKAQVQKQCLAEASKKIEETMRAHKILTEKLAAATQSKLFFKEQWAKAVREIRQLRSGSEGSSLQKKNSEMSSRRRYEMNEEELNDAVMKKLNLRPDVLKEEEFEDFDIQNIEYDPVLLSPPFSLETVKEKELLKRSHLLSSGQESSNRKLNNCLRSHLSTS
ncbi:uncharacterized protein [Bemisia tabaci]|uniref:uncharacterized protein isoform X1 n=1 Tax=Bemisia tabaci TaxID=7038 RepID=UPI003B285D9A